MSQTMHFFKASFQDFVFGIEFDNSWSSFHISHIGPGHFVIVMAMSGAIIS